MGKYKIINISRAGTLAHVPEAITFDDGIVIDESQTDRHAITGEAQPKTVFSGSMPDCIKWVEAKRGARVTKLDPGQQSIQPGRTMSKAWAFGRIVGDVKESIRCQDSQEDEQVLTEALQILEEHLQETFYKA